MVGFITEADAQNLTIQFLKILEKPQNHIGSKCRQFAFWRVEWLFQHLQCQDANSVISGDIIGYHNDNIWSQHWWQSWHHNNTQLRCSKVVTGQQWNIRGHVTALCSYVLPVSVTHWLATLANNNVINHTSRWKGQGYCSNQTFTLGCKKCYFHSTLGPILI